MRRRNFITGLLAAPLGVLASKFIPQNARPVEYWVGTRVPRSAAFPYSGMTATQASEAMSVAIRHFLQVEKFQALGNTVDVAKVTELISETLGSKT